MKRLSSPAFVVYLGLLFAAVGCQSAPQTGRAEASLRDNPEEASRSEPRDSWRGNIAKSRVAKALQAARSEVDDPPMMPDAVVRDIAAGRAAFRATRRRAF